MTDRLTLKESKNTYGNSKFVNRSLKKSNPFMYLNRHLALKIILKITWKKCNRNGDLMKGSKIHILMNCFIATCMITRSLISCLRAICGIILRGTLILHKENNILG